MKQRKELFDGLRGKLPKFTPETTIPVLQKTLARHFPDAPRPRVIFFAKRIHEWASVARQHQWLMKDVTTSAEEAKRLEQAADHLRAAADKLTSLEVLGISAVHDFATVFHRSYKMNQEDASESTLDSLKFVLGVLQEIEEGIRSSASKVPSVSKTVDPSGATHSLSRRRGRPREPEANYAAQAAYSAFVELSGRKPSVTTNPHKDGNPATGPFHDLIVDLFKDLEIGASPETWARKVCKEKNGSPSE